MRINKCFICENLIFTFRKQIINAIFETDEVNQIFDSYKCSHCEQTVISIKNIKTLKTKKIWLELENEKKRLENLAESHRLKVIDKKNSQKVINTNLSKFENIKEKIINLEHSMKASMTIRLQSSKSERWVQNYNLQKILKK